MSQAKKIKVTSKKVKLVAASTIRRKLRKRMKYYARMTKEQGDRPWYGWYVIVQLVYHNLLGEMPPDYMGDAMFETFQNHVRQEDE